MELATINISDIEVGERFRVDIGNLKELMVSIQEEGLIQPIAVARQTEHKYKLLAGGRRLRACQELKMESIPARIYPKELSELDSRSVELAENIYRKSLRWSEESKLKAEIHRLQIAKHGEKISKNPDDTGWTKEQTGKIFGIGASSISVDLALAAALKTFPQLADAKTKKDAIKFLEKTSTDYTRAQKAREIEHRDAKTPEDTVRERIAASYILKDTLLGMSDIPDNSVDFIDADPPYAVGKEGSGLHGIKKTSGGGLSGTEEYTEVIDHTEYPKLLKSWYKECGRILSDTGWMIVWFGPQWFDQTLGAIRFGGIQTRHMPCIWAKGGGQTNVPQIYLASGYEPFFYGHGGRGNIIKQGRDNVFSFKPVTPTGKIHPTEKPVELMQEILATFVEPGSRVFVPFLGSGNTLLAANNLGMSGFGFDLSKNYRDAFVVRVYEGKPRNYRSY